MPTAPVSEDIPTAEVVPLILFVLLIILERVTDGLYQGLGRPQPDALPFLETLATWVALSAWFSAYAQRYRIALVMDFGWLLIGIWLIAVPYFLFKTQGWRAFVPIGACVALVLVANMLGFMVSAAVR
jgi:hypothetical protein